ncbi:hypothetical protein [Luteolibacter soli]|uniref:Uncharacterized protein n=1 Tax=Luteolibacter soli TaxID=3135280 RepID=A0ABU9ATP5_9BACT
MNAIDSKEHEVLERTLGEVRRVRRHRAARRMAVMPLLMMLGAGWFALTRGPAPAPPVMTEAPQAAHTAGESLTVVEWKDGMPSLVEYSGKDLGKLELAFSLEPVVTFPEELW